ncbi:hypothetical protein [Clostridium sp.]|uniref:hypothetical protein n=1 Tax=Clostridium sp. TaxID=1506 RepID=UPI0032166E8B
MSYKNFKIENIVIKYLCFFIIGIILFFMSYGFFSKFSFNKGERYLSNTMKSIWKVNNRSKSFLDNNHIDVEKALSVLPEMKADLIDISIDLNSSPYIKEAVSSENFGNLSKGLNENILVIEQIDAMLKNPYGSDIELAANNLKTFRDTTENYYRLISLKDSSYDLGIPMYSAINSTIDYCISSNNLKKISDLKSAESTKFIETLRELVISLDSLKYNFYEDVLKCRSGNMTYELLISNIDDTSKKLVSVQNVLSQMSIPNDFSSLYKDYSEIVSLYNDYLYGIKYAILTEKVRRESKDLKEDFMDSLYVSSNEIYDKVEKMYKNFTKEYNNLNSNY